jgi:serine/threonine-protein kinase
VDEVEFGRYRLISLIGRGGMGEVWRAHDTATDRIVAIKVLSQHLADDETFKARFRREAHSAARLDSPHVVPIHDYGEIDGRLYVTMRLIKGRDLQAVLADGPLPPARAVRIIEQVAKALQAAHEIGLVHRDVKPSNVLLDKDDYAYLIDFGIARAAQDTKLTSTGSMIGTLQYLAPERLGTGEVDARADIYALACVLFECLTGSPPFPGESPERLMAAHLSTPPPQPSTAQPDVPTQFDEVIATGMAKDPDHRYATTVELADAARDAITVPTPRPTPTPAPNPPPKQATGPVTTPRAPRHEPPHPPSGYHAPAGPSPEPTAPATSSDGSLAAVQRNDPILRVQGINQLPTQMTPTEFAPPPRPFPPTQPPVRRLSRRTKTVVIVGAVAVVAAIAVAISATFQHQPSRGTQPVQPNTPSPTTTATASTTTATASPTTATASSGPRWEAGQQMIVDAFPTLLPPTPDGKGFGDVSCTAGTAFNNPTVSCGPGYDSSKPSFIVECNQTREPMTSDDSNPYGKVPMEKLVSTQQWTKPSGSGQITRYADQYGWGYMYVRFDGARSFCSLSARASVSVLEAWWSAAPV